MKMIGNIICGIVMFFFVMLLFYNIDRSDNAEIEKWSAKNHYTLVSRHQRLNMLGYGPFYYRQDNQRIYEVKVLTSDGKPKTYYFRIGLLTEIEEYKN